MLGGSLDGIAQHYIMPQIALNSIILSPLQPLIT
jgi:hypothetical protein